MTQEELQSRLHDLERLLQTGNNFTLVEAQVRELLVDDGLVKGSELHCRILLNLSSVSWQQGNARQGLQCAEEALDLAVKLDNASMRVMALTDVALAYAHLSEYSVALTHFMNVIALCEEFGNKKGLASAISSVGIVYHSLAENDKSLEYSFRALSLYEELGYRAGIARAFGNIGMTYSTLSDYAKALEYYSQALALFEELENKNGVAGTIGNIALVYENLEDFPKALEYLHVTIDLFEELGNNLGVARNLINIGSVYSALSDYHKALEYQNRAAALCEELGSKSGLAGATSNIGSAYAKLSDSEKAFENFNRAYSLFVEIGDKAGVARTQRNLAQLYTNEQFSGYDTAKAEDLLLKALSTFTELGAKKDLYEVHLSLAELCEKHKQWEEFAVHYKKFYELEKEVQSSVTKKQAERLDVERKSAERDKQLAVERARFQERESILNNILPEQITSRLINGEKPIADQFEAVSILFMDIVDFTRLSASISAQQLVHLLNAIFTSADVVIREFGLEKIKTIGDAYMAVAGAPVVQEDHAKRAADAALKLRDVMKNLVVSFPAELGDQSWIDSLPEIEVRIGLHCGPVAAGVVGENKFLYDLWGDAVNTASRMESHGAAGRIHLSEEFAKHLIQTISKAEHVDRDSHSLERVGLQLVDRGELEIKGKGTMRTYFLERAA